jgi:hypothetical protein
MEGEIGNKKMIIDIAQLQIRVVPKKQQVFEVKVHKVDTEVTDVDIEKKEDLKKHILFKDKRKSSTNLVDRNAILKRLNMKFLVEKNIISQAPAIIKTDEDTELYDEMKRLVTDKDNVDIEEKISKEKQLVNFEEKSIDEEEEEKEKEDKDKEEEEKEDKDKEEEEKEDKEEEEFIKPIFNDIGKDVVKKKRTGKKKQVDFIIDEPIDLTISKIGNHLVSERLPKKQKIKMGVSPYYMNNRKLFISQLAKMFQPYRDAIAENAGEISCKNARNDSIDFELLSHQLVVRDYLNLYTPYRGLLLYHGLGSGKTCTSIGIAEGMKTGKSIILMTPASLKMNFFSELKKCGDMLYKKHQFWEFISIKGEPQNINILVHALGLSREYITKHSGAWMIDVKKTSNFSQLSDNDQKSVDEQLNAMIRNKYQDINYNGLNVNKMNELTDNGKKNPFDNKVVIIDEAHNLVSRIANSTSKKNSIANQMYKYLMDATNAKIVFLTGTPIINTPREISILFNMLRGYIKTWTFQLQTNTSAKINNEIILDYFRDSKFATYDYIDYSGDKLIVTRNPFGFVNKYTNKKRGGKNKSKKVKQIGNKRITKKRQKNEIFDTDTDTDTDTEIKQRENEYNKLQNDLYEGGGTFEDYSGVMLDEYGNISDAEFQKQIIHILKKNGISVIGKPKIVKEVALPDDEKLFYEWFINNEKGELINTDLLKRRILGLTSYFRSAQEQLLPRFVKDEGGSNYHIINIDMSPHQFDLYEDIRKNERDDEAKKRRAKARKKGQENEEETLTSTYRIYSRSVCNFAFPSENPRPMINIADEDEDEDEGINSFNAITEDIQKKSDEYFEEGEKEENKEGEYEKKKVNKKEYQEKIKETYDFLMYNPSRQRDQEYLRERELSKYSPKFVKILENIKNEDNRGLHLLYSQFRTLEGIGIFKLVLEANGFIEFKISKKGGDWHIENADLDPEKPRFVLYTGTETAEEKEIIRNIYNSAWEFVPPSIVSVLKEKNQNNFYGEIIKVLMITSSGAEGINLRNTRFVHILEPYWNMVRIDQVVGRARRICSHEDLPEDMRTVQVYIYISRITDEQLRKNIEMRTQDISKLKYQVLQKNGEIKMENIPFSTDQYLFEIAQIKDSINKQILTAVKESAIDCSLYNNNPDEPLVCYGFGKVSSNNFGSYPVFEVDRSQKPEINVKTVKQVLVAITIDGVKYAMDKQTRIVYDLQSYKNAKNKTGELIAIGKLDERINKIVSDK